MFKHILSMHNAYFVVKQYFRLTNIQDKEGIKQFLKENDNDVTDLCLSRYALLGTFLYAEQEFSHFIYKFNDFFENNGGINNKNMNNKIIIATKVCDIIFF